MARAIPDVPNAPQRSSFYETFSGALGPWKLMRLVRWGRPRDVFRNFPSIMKVLNHPTLLIHGTRDILPESFAARAVQLITNSQLLKVDSGHFIPIDCADEVSRNLLAYFRSQGAEIASISGPSNPGNPRATAPALDLNPALAH